MIVQETDKVYKKEKEIQKGIAFPTQANINNCICHYAPLSSVGSNGKSFGMSHSTHLNQKIDQSICFGSTPSLFHYCSDFIVKENDIVKLDLGVHIDGYIAVVAHTVFMSEEKKGKAVDAMLAAHYCAEAALRLVAPGIEVCCHVISEAETKTVFRILKSQTSYQKFPSLMVVRQSRECYHTKW